MAFLRRIRHGGKLALRSIALMLVPSDLFFCKLLMTRATGEEQQAQLITASDREGESRGSRKKSHGGGTNGENIAARSHSSRAYRHCLQNKNAMEFGAPPAEIATRAPASRKRRPLRSEDTRRTPRSQSDIFAGTASSFTPDPV